MYSRSAWGGAVDPFILTTFVKNDEADPDDPLVSVVVFEWQDEKYIGKLPTADSVQREYICDAQNVEAQFCNSTQLGEFILQDDIPKKRRDEIYTIAMPLNSPTAINYAVGRTGYYCVGTYGYSAKKYTAVVEFRNAYGELPAAQIPKLPFYGGLSITYAVIGAFWAFLYVQYRSDICMFPYS
jgi:Lung seven transmembrane receptor